MISTMSDIQAVERKNFPTSGLSLASWLTTRSVSWIASILLPRHDLDDAAGLENVVLPDRHLRADVDRLDEVPAEVRVELEREVERGGLLRHEEAVRDDAALAVLELADPAGVDGLAPEELERGVVEHVLDPCRA